MSEIQEPSPTAAEVIDKLEAWRKHDCARCCYWRAGNIVLRGNTLGICKAGQGTTAADDSCDEWTLDE